MTVSVAVWQKDGLCRGPAIGNATFRAVSKDSIVYYDIPLAATGGPPLSGSENVYTVVGPRGLTVWYLRVASPIHNPWDFYVVDGETHQVWLTRQ